VQIDLRLDPILPTAKLLQDRHLDAGPVVNEFVASGELWVSRIAAQAFT
jgi:hypothetical protein